MSPFGRYALIIFLLNIFYSNCQYLSIPNFFKPRFKQSSTMGLYLAVVFPIDLPGREAYLGWFFEAIYSLPSNETDYEYPPLLERQIDRQNIYDVIERNIEKKGFSGKSCLLRTICELGLYSVERFNGIFGDVLHLLFTPSTSENPNLSIDYPSAEMFGKKHRHCKIYNKNCSLSLLELVSRLENQLS